MQFIVLFVAFLLIIEGVSEIFFPDKIRSMMIEVYKEIPPKALGILYCFMGISLNFASRWCAVREIVLLVGSIFFVLGFLITIFSEKKTRYILERFSKASTMFYRLWGILLSLAGVLLIIAR